MSEIILPPPVLYILEALEAKGFESYVVGGAVRDILLDRPTKDWDFTTNATPEKIIELFSNAFYDNEFGTVGVAFEHIQEMMQNDNWLPLTDVQINAFKDQVFEITTFRTDIGYADHRRPDSVTWGSTLSEDLSRRDFTINALAIQKPKDSPLKIIDLYHGQRDLNHKLIRTVGAANMRFGEDALRMMRAIRFGAQLGFRIDPETLEAIQQNSQLITHISFERIRDELLKIIASAYPADGITLLYTSHLLQHIIPEMLPMRGVKQGGHHLYDVWTHSVESLRHCPSTDPITRLAALLHDIGKPKTMRLQGPRGVTFYGHEVVGQRIVEKIGLRLRLSNHQQHKLNTLVRYHMFAYQPEMTDAAIRRFIKNVSLEYINDMMLLRVGDRKGGGSKASSWRLRELQQRIGENLYEPLSIKDLKIDGTDVMNALNIPPGRKVGEILNMLFDEVMEDTSKNTQEYLIKRAKEIA